MVSTMKIHALVFIAASAVGGLTPAAASSADNATAEKQIRASLAPRRVSRNQLGSSHGL
jgi:hypothetical protein